MSQPRFRPGSPWMRWVPTIAVVVAPIACAVAAISRSEDTAGTLSQLALPLCMVSAAIVSLVQPRPLYPTPGGSLDERETGLRWEAYARGLGVTCLLGMLICFYMTWAPRHGWRQPSQSDWQNLLLLMICWIFGMPMAFANWMVGRPLDDDEDDE